MSLVIKDKFVLNLIKKTAPQKGGAVLQIKKVMITL